MIRTMNLDPGPQGRIPLYAIIPRMAPEPLNDYIQRYSALRGKDMLYQLLQFGRVVFVVGFFGVLGTVLFDFLLHR
jgi:hypothetical protein